MKFSLDEYINDSYQKEIDNEHGMCDTEICLFDANWEETLLRYQIKWEYYEGLRKLLEELRDRRLEEKE